MFHTSAFFIMYSLLHRVPVDSPTGQPVYAEAIVAGKRKDAVVACALEACRILDRYGLLRKKEHGEFFFLKFLQMQTKYDIFVHVYIVSILLEMHRQEGYKCTGFPST